MQKVISDPVKLIKTSATKFQIDKVAKDFPTLFSQSLSSQNLRNVLNPSK